MEPPISEKRGKLLGGVAREIDDISVFYNLKFYYFSFLLYSPLK